MLIIGCEYHPGVQQIAFMDTGTGSSVSVDSNTVREKRKSSTAICSKQESACEWGWRQARAARFLAVLSMRYARARPAKVIRDGRDTWLATSSPEPQTLAVRVSFLGEGP